LHESIRSVKWGGKIVVLGVFDSGYIYPLVARDLFIKEINLMGSNAYVPNDFRNAVTLIESYESILGGFISHRFPLSKFNEALIAAWQKQGFTMKIILEMEGIHHD